MLIMCYIYPLIIFDYQELSSLSFSRLIVVLLPQAVVKWYFDFVAFDGLDLYLGFLGFFSKECVSFDWGHVYYFVFFCFFYKRQKNIN